METTTKDSDNLVERAQSLSLADTGQTPGTQQQQQVDNETIKNNIRLVIQRFRKASLLINESTMVTVDSAGILVYVSFSKSATKEKVMQAAKTIMNLPILTRGLWGDGSEQSSVLDMATSNEKGEVAVMLVPQANLISKVKSQGKSIQYHDQIDKAAGEALYNHFVDCIQAIALEHQLTIRKESIPKWLSDFGKPQKVDASVPPSQLFRDFSVYSSFDEDGIPLTDQNGEPLTKSAIKKLKKQYQAHKKRHEKYLDSNKTGLNESGANKTMSSPQDWNLLDDSFIRIVAGSFGKRQGLEMESDMGPFCHVLNL